MNSTAINWEMIATLIAAMTLIGAIFTAIFNRIRNDIKKAVSSGVDAQRLTNVESQVASLKEEIKETRNTLTSRIDSLIDIAAQRGLAESNSPRQLTDEGRKVLRSSGIDSIVEDKFDYIVRESEKQSPKNPYQAEQAVFDAVEKLSEDPAVKDAIEEGAFNSGYPILSVLFVGGLHVRDRVLERLGFKVDDIDKHSPQ